MLGTVSLLLSTQCMFTGLELAYVAIIRNCPLGDAGNRPDLEREVCSGAKQVFSHFQYPKQNIFPCLEGDKNFAPNFFLVQ